MYKKALYTLFLSLALVFSACGSNEKEDDSNGTKGGAIDTSVKITSSIQAMTIDKSSGNFSADIIISSGYAGDVTLNGLKTILTSCKLVPGSESSAPVVVTLGADNKSKEIKVTGTLIDPSCVPSAYRLEGEQSLVQDGQTTTTPFSTKNIVIPNNLISSEDVNNLKLEVLDKRIDMNETSALKPIRLRVIKGKIGAKNKKVKLMTAISSGSMHANVVESDTSGDAVFNYTSPASMLDTNMTVKFCLESDLSVCDTAIIVLTTSKIVPPIELIDNINYLITFKPKGGANNLQLGARNNAIVSLIDKDTQKSIPSNRIKNITVSSEDVSVLKLTPEGGGEPSGSLNISNRNDVSILLTADEVNSGLVPLKIVIEYFNLNGILKTRGQLFSVAVLSGAPTAFSITSAGVAYNSETKQFEQKFIVQATDSSANPISTSGVINVSAMASFAKDAAGREILYGRHSNGVSATLSPDGQKAQIELTSGGLTPFNTTNIDENRAFVAVFGNVNTYEANGKWNIKKGSLSGDSIKFTNNYSGGVYSGLGMAVGYNYRDKFCSSTYEESVVVIDSSDGKYSLDETGKAFVVLKHDAYMIGKRIMLMVNMTGLNPSTGKLQRTGEVHETTLRFNKYLISKSFSIPKSRTNYSITMYGSIATGTPDIYSLLNSKFSCGIDASDGITSIKLVEENNPTSCAGKGIAFQTYEVSTSADGGTVTFGKCVPESEADF